MTVQDLLNYVLILTCNEHWWQWGVRLITWNEVRKGSGQL
jgi:hypothetical protein